MKIAIISDIHGNHIALEAVLKDIKKRGSFDSIIVLGDYFAFGPAPNEVFDQLCCLPATFFLLGNTDRYLAQRHYPLEPNGDPRRQQLRLSFQWTARTLSSNALKFLETLPSVQIMQIHQKQLLAVHGSPRSDEEGLTAHTTDDEMRQMLLNNTISVLVCGHTHIPMDRIINGVRVVNAGSIGLPFDGNSQACYAIVSNLNTNNPHSIDVEMIRVGYNVEQVIALSYAMGHPAADIIAHHLKTGLPMAYNIMHQKTHSR